MINPLPLYQVRPYTSGADYHLVAEWWRTHGMGEFQETLLPPDGYIVQRDGEDVAAAWLYLSNGIGVAFMEWVVTRPGLSLKEARTALGHVIECMRRYANANDYGVIWCNTLPAIARFAAHHGFRAVAQDRVSMILKTDE